MRKDIQCNIGITGKVGSGKSYTGRYLSDATGLEYINFDEHLAEILRLPVLKQYAQLRFDSEIICNDGKMMETFRNMQTPLYSFEKLALFTLCNLRLKKLLSGIPKIIDFAALPLLSTAHRFRDNILVKGDERKRIFMACQRDNISEETIVRFDGFVNDMVDYDKLKYTDKVLNDYTKKPDNLDEIAERIIAKYC